MKNKKGKFIVLEGIDNCGKDTQQDLLQKYFSDFVFVKVLDEHKEKSKKLRETIFNKDFKFIDKAEIYLFYADKEEMMGEIKKALDSGKNVICNRFELSQYAYQIYGKQKPEYLELTNYLTKSLQEIDAVNYYPDLYILFDISPTESQKRKHARTNETGKFEDYYDNAKADFFERVINGYKTEIQNFSHVIIKGENTKEKVFEETLLEIKKLCNV